MADDPCKLDGTSRYRDPITGFEGVATARTEFAFDTPSVRLTRASDKGLPQDEWFSEPRVEPVEDTGPPPSNGVGFARTED